MAKNKYKVPVKFIFIGYFEVVAHTGSEAMKLVNDDCGLVIGGNIHSDLPDEDIDWNFNVHPNKRISLPKVIEKGIE